jgi:DNA topoisomerase-1
VPLSACPALFGPALLVVALHTPRYVWLGATSSFKSESDLAKYEKARKLKDYIVTIRKNYTADWDSTDLRKKQVGAGKKQLDLGALNHTPAHLWCQHCPCRVGCCSCSQACVV